MTDRHTHVIIGAGLAGATAAETLRAEGARGHVVVLGAEPHLPYDRPALSKHYLRDECDLASLLIHDQAFYDDLDIELRLQTRVVDLDVDRRTLLLDDDEELAYDRLLLATGARPKRLPVSGAELSGLHSLRNLDDLWRLQAEVSEGDRVVVVGGGWTGTEVAASFRQLGHPVAIVEASPKLFGTTFGSDVSEVFHKLHRSHGVDLHVGEQVVGFSGSERVDGVVTTGHTIPADLVVVAVGVEPRVELACRGGLRVVGDAIATDELLRTSAPGVLAAGDAAASWNRRYRSHLLARHWDNGQRQGVAAARNMLGAAEPYTRLPYRYSDQFDFTIDCVGIAPSWDRVLVRGSLDNGGFCVFWLRDGCVDAAMIANAWDVIEPLEVLIGAQVPVPDRLLCDPGVPLGAIAAMV